jgi:hypothetical protein
MHMKRFIIFASIYLFVLLVILYLFTIKEGMENFNLEYNLQNYFKNFQKTISYFIYWVLPYWWIILLVLTSILSFLTYLFLKYINK